MNYHFFDYKKNIIGYSGQDMFSTTHFVFMFFMLALLIVLCIVFRKAREKNIIKYMKILSVILPILDVAKLVWESIWDIRMVGEFNYGGILPLYTCSMFIYLLPLAAFGKGKVRKYSMSFLTTIGIVAGFTNFIYLSVLNSYPLFTYATMYSAVYHFLMVFTGILLMVTGVYRPTFRDAFDGVVSVYLFSIIVLPINYIISETIPWVDYMLCMRAEGLPLVGPLSDFFRDRGMLPVFNLIVGVMYYVANFITVSIEQLIFFLTLKKKKKNAELPLCEGDDLTENEIKTEG